MQDMATAVHQATGVSVIAGCARRGAGEGFRAHDPHTGAPSGLEYTTATEADVSDAVDAATAAFDRARSAPLEAVVAVADLLDEHAPVLVGQAAEETGLSEARLSGEVGRTSGQLRFMADLARRGERLDATIDHGDPGSGRPDVRRVGVPIGPVAVFGSSNFPFAFSVLGGDTASALAAGCPVVVKAHESHPATSELCARLMVQALGASGSDPGWFSLLQGRSRALGHALVTAPGIRAVGFTGSLPGGRALFDSASRRPHPIPVYAEMGSVNPVFVTAASAARRPEAIADALAASLTGSAGQLCTKPNLIVLPVGSEGEQLERALADAFAGRPLHPLVNHNVRDGFVAGMRAARALPGVTRLSAQSASGGSGAGAVAGADAGAVPGSDDEGALTVPGMLLSASLESLLSHEELRSEHFGPAAVVVRCPEEAFGHVVQRLEGSLTATVHFEPETAEQWRSLVQRLAAVAGRVIVNGVPTGVAVVRAMHHGGPYPATTSVRDTSVGAMAMDRFLRPVCFQDMPNALLPAALQDANPLGIWRRVDGELTSAAIGEM